MGNCTQKKKIDVYFVNETPEEIASSVGFSKELFKHKEWDALKSFCQKRDVKTNHLNELFNRYLSPERNPEAFIREFRVKTMDTKVTFLKHTRLFQELADIYVPLIYLRDYKGLDKPHSPEEVSFARFMIMSYIFCAQPAADLILDCIILMRNRMKLSLNYALYTFNFHQIVSILTEELKPSEALKYVLKYINVKNDTEITIQQMVNIGLRYPLLFYSLFRFRSHFKRLIFGDKFWKDRKLLKSRINLESGLQHNRQLQQGFANEEVALRDTARAILADIKQLIDLERLKESTRREAAIANGEEVKEEEKEEGVGKFVNTIKGHLALSGTPPPPLKSISNEFCVDLKSIFGYQFTRSIILESGLSYDKDMQVFIDLPVDNGTEDVRLYDHMIEREFLYNAAHGTRLWITKFYDPHLGEVLKELTYQYGPRLHPISANSNGKRPDTANDEEEEDD